MVRALFVAALGLAAAPAVAAAPLPPQAAIDGSIRDWHADHQFGIYLREDTGRWYYAQFRNVCPGVLRGNDLMFRANGQQFDRSSQVITELETCQVESLVRSPGPAAKGGPGPNGPSHF